MEGKLQASAVYTEKASYTNHISAVEFDDTDRIRLGYAYLALRDWEKALRIFECFSNQPSTTLQEGPWGRGGTVVFTDKLADYCRKQLGALVASATPEFKIGKPLLQLCRESAFQADEQGLWIGLYGQLLHLDFNLHTNLVLNLPESRDALVTALGLASCSVWIGTDGGGLYEYDKGTGQFRHFDQANGLLMDRIASLCLTADALWIGYGEYAPRSGRKTAGGLGKIDRRSRECTSYTPSVLEGPPAQGLAAFREPTDKPTRCTVLAVAEGAPGEIWFLTYENTPTLRRYRVRDNLWDGGAMQACSALLRGSERLYLSQNWNYFGQAKTGPAGVSFADLGDPKSPWQTLGTISRLAPGRVTAMTLDREKLWIGGVGYVAQMDATSGEIRTVANVQTEAIDRIQVGGGYLWLQFDCCLARAQLPGPDASFQSK